MTGLDLGVVALASAVVLLAGCGGGSHGGVAQLGSNAASSTAAGGGPASLGSPESEALAFAKCMRSGGLPNFPDPSGGGFLFTGVLESIPPRLRSRRRRRSA